MSNRRRDPTASLRAASRAEARKADKRERDNRQAAFDYMQQRGAFAAIGLGPDQVARVTGDLTWRFDDHTIQAYVQSLPWNPDASKRITCFEISYIHPAEGRWTKPRSYKNRARFIETKPAYTTTTVIPVPHWDYDGVDPLIAREPWERAEANRQLNYLNIDESWRALWSIQDDAHQMECSEQLREQHAHIPDACTFPYATGPEG
jgi:hypothetical protein